MGAAAGAPGPWERVSDAATSFPDYLARLSDPANSDLPAVLAATAAERGAALVRADLDGQGRAAFGGYWANGPSADDAPCCRDVVVEAAGAASVPAQPGLVQVAVVWSAWRRNELLAHRTTVVYFAASAGGLQPRHLFDLAP